MGNHVWQYCSLGGVIRVKIASGEDIAHLGELDEKYWTVLSCPVNGLAMDSHTLAYIDSDSDGKIRVAEVVSAAAASFPWIPSMREPPSGRGSRSRPARFSTTSDSRKRIR